MAYFDPDEILQTKEEALDYMEAHGIMTDATFPKLNDTENTDKHMAPVYKYLRENGMYIFHTGFYDRIFNFGAIYFMFDANHFDYQTAPAEVKKILSIWSNSQSK
ncbi:hypothetical protein [Lactiplantibacillus plantarum]|uniref:hypothetical protein n=1 Tax=Lactiplantibacillus plantarum TaxID=1590 RepID=UPI001082131D|nr:hypothetical protein [Lactiplantibacillus plantarum]MCH8625522.1 hypothetical protein [Lactiplantibacillus plantarum]MCH8632010.1 hypothetical protein [Lactiplantibacillus plantarum]MCH8634968.1 hypothetical protein [Lactiplantibacillus plantarum]QBX93213.1 hypothetical protein DVH03_02115 [Lactiplantibacillus plantarum]